MANGFSSIGKNRGGRGARAPKIGGGGRTDLQETVGLLVLRDIMKQQQEQRQPALAAEETAAKGEATQLLKRQGAMRAVTRSAEAVTASIGRLAKGYTAAHREAGVGSRGRQIASDVALWFGGESGDAFQSTAALPGLKTEVITRMMPILTQQGEKEGSVRLIRSIWERISQTLPGKVEGAKSARSQMATSINNMYGFSKAFFDMGIRAGDVERMDESAFNTYMTELQIAKDRVLETPEEQQRISDIQSSALIPLDNLIEETRGKAPLRIPPIPGLGGGRQSGRIKVENIETGQTGTISEQFFDPQKYKRR